MLEDTFVLIFVLAVTSLGTEPRQAAPNLATLATRLNGRPN